MPIVTPTRKFVCPEKVCSETKINMNIGKISFHCLIEQTSVAIEGQVTRYATKIGFTEGETTAFTYIKTGSTGWCSDIHVSHIFSFFNYPFECIYILTDPFCRSDEICSTPVFVSYKDGAIEPHSVILPFVAAVSGIALQARQPRVFI